jgi:hypothetical protein
VQCSQTKTKIKHSLKNIVSSTWRKKYEILCLDYTIVVGRRTKKKKKTSLCSDNITGERDDIAERLKLKELKYKRTHNTGREVTYRVTYNHIWIRPFFLLLQPACKGI